MNSRKNTTISSKYQQISETKYLLPPEIWTQIFATLPARTLLKFMYVCKSWRSIIDHPDFVSMHIKLWNNNSKLLVLHDYYEGCMLTVCEADMRQNICRIFRNYDFKLYHIFGNYNGLRLVNQKDALYRHADELRLWNPSIRKSLILPANPIPRSLITTTRYLFGFAPDSKDYKVVALIFGESLGESRKVHFAVYTLSDQQWTVRYNQFNITLPDTYGGGYGPFHSVSTAVFFQGAAYWLGQNDNQSETSEFTHLCSFDFDKENITFLELPISLNETGFLRFPFLLGESLAIFSICEESSSIWVLERDNVKRPWSLWFLGKSSSEGYVLFKCCNCERQKIIYYETNGRYYFFCKKKLYSIVSCKVYTILSMGSDIQLETYSESLVLSKGYGTRYLGDFP